MQMTRRDLLAAIPAVAVVSPLLAKSTPVQNAKTGDVVAMLNAALGLELGYENPICEIHGFKIFVDDDGFLPSTANTKLVAKLLAWKFDPEAPVRMESGDILCGGPYGKGQDLPGDPDQTKCSGRYRLYVSCIGNAESSGTRSYHPGEDLGKGFINGCKIDGKFITEFYKRDCDSEMVRAELRQSLVHLLGFMKMQEQWTYKCPDCGSSWYSFEVSNNSPIECMKCGGTKGVMTSSIR